MRDANGVALDLAKFRGRVLLLHGWAGWCAYCPKDYAAIKKLRAEIPGDKLAIVGLNLDAAAAECRRSAAKNGFDWPQVALGTKQAEPAAAKLALGAVPLYVVVDAAGVVRHRGWVWAEAENVARELGR